MVNMSTVWDRTAEFLTDNLGTVLPIALLAFFVPASIGGSVANLRDGGTDQLRLMLSLLSLGFAIVSIWGSLAITALALDPNMTTAPGATARARLLPALAVSVAMLLAVVVLCLPLLVALVAGGVDLAGMAPGEVPVIPPAVGAFIGLYAVALAIVALWLGARMALVTPLVIAEKRMFDAIPRSWRLTRGVTFAIIGVVLLYALVMTVSILATQAVFGIVFSLIAGSKDGISIAGVLTSIMVAAVQTGFTVIGPAFTAKLYLALAASRGAATAS